MTTKKFPHQNPEGGSGGGLLQSPIFLLLVTGTLIGFNFPLGKIAGLNGISPMIWSMILSLGATGLLLPILIAKRHLALPKGKMIPYLIISALISFVIPNLLLFSVIPHAGAGYTGLMFALSPVFTLGLAAMFRHKTPTRMGLLGIGLGLIGATIVSISQGAGPEAPSLIWIIAAIMIPVSLAFGNIYRSAYWPDKALPDVLAFWSHAFAVLVFGFLLVITQGTIPVSELARAPWAVAAQLLVGGLLFPVFFRLQQKGGPVLLSQIGYIAAAVGLIAATVVLGEQYRPLTWAGAGVIAFGIIITIVAQINERKQLQVSS